MTAGDPVDLAKAALLAQRIVALKPDSGRSFDLRAEVIACEAEYLARAVLRQGAILDDYEARLAELEGRK